MTTVLLAAGAVIHIQGIPFNLGATVPAETHENNLTLIEGHDKVFKRADSVGMVGAMPVYQCHKQVRAIKIKHFEANTLRGTFSVIPVDGDIEPVQVNEFWMDKNKPEPGGYLVEYEDGYQSYSPAKAFEEGYTRI